MTKNGSKKPSTTPTTTFGILYSSYLMSEEQLDIPLLCCPNPLHFWIEFRHDVDQALGLSNRESTWGDRSTSYQYTGRNSTLSLGTSYNRQKFATDDISKPLQDGMTTRRKGRLSIPLRLWSRYNQEGNLSWCCMLYKRLDKEAKGHRLLAK